MVHPPRTASPSPPALLHGVPRPWASPPLLPHVPPRLVCVLSVLRAGLRLQPRLQGGAAETVEILCRRAAPRPCGYPSDFVGRIADLAKEYDDDEIPASLDREGLQSSTGKSFTASMISWMRFKHRISGPSRPTGTLSVAQVGQRYGVLIGSSTTGSRKASSRHTEESLDCPTLTITVETDRALRERMRCVPPLTYRRFDLA